MKQLTIISALAALALITTNTSEVIHRNPASGAIQEADNTDTITGTEKRISVKNTKKGTNEVFLKTEWSYIKDNPDTARNGYTRIAVKNQNRKTEAGCDCNWDTKYVLVSNDIAQLEKKLQGELKKYLFNDKLNKKLINTEKSVFNCQKKWVKISQAQTSEIVLGGSSNSSTNSNKLVAEKFTNKSEKLSCLVDRVANIDKDSQKEKQFFKHIYPDLARLAKGSEEDREVAENLLAQARNHDYPSRVEKVLDKIEKYLNYRTEMSEVVADYKDQEEDVRSHIESMYESGAFGRNPSIAQTQAKMYFNQKMLFGKQQLQNEIQVLNMSLNNKYNSTLGSSIFGDEDSDLSLKRINEEWITASNNASAQVYSAVLGLEVKKLSDQNTKVSHANNTVVSSRPVHVTLQRNTKDLPAMATLDRLIASPAKSSVAVVQDNADTKTWDRSNSNWCSLNADYAIICDGDGFNSTLTRLRSR